MIDPVAATDAASSGSSTSVSTVRWNATVTEAGCVNTFHVTEPGPKNP